MNRRTILGAVPLALLLPARIAENISSIFDLLPHEGLQGNGKGNKDAMQRSTTVYELRIYHAAPGKIDELLARFRDHTDKLFAKHGMRSLAYWTALDEPAKSNIFFYILEHPSREAAAANWKAFQDDPEWNAAKAQSEEHGKLVDSIDSTFLALTDFSPLPRA